MFHFYRGRTAACDEQHATAPFHVALPPPDLNDREHRKAHLSSETDRGWQADPRAIHKASPCARSTRRVDATNKHRSGIHRERRPH